MGKVLPSWSQERKQRWLAWIRSLRRSQPWALLRSKPQKMSGQDEPSVTRSLWSCPQVSLMFGAARVLSCKPHTSVHPTWGRRAPETLFPSNWECKDLERNWWAPWFRKKWGQPSEAAVDAQGKDRKDEPQSRRNQQGARPPTPQASPGSCWHWSGSCWMASGPPPESGCNGVGRGPHVLMLRPHADHS